ncbi:MAG: hypothetical protein M3540_04955 [Actinomycetota bacterium]|nr:hypothetical protein [Actinomycetota bacterium]
MRRALILCVLAALLAPGVARAGGPSLTIGGVEDAFKQPTIPAAKAKLDLAKLAGLRAVRMTVTWERGRVQPEDVELEYLRNAVAAAGLSAVDVYLSITFGSRNTPLTDDHRQQFAEFCVTLSNDLPSVRYFTIGNEPNLNRFWLPQFGPNGEDVAAPAYGKLLAVAYDALKGVNPQNIVIGGAVSPRGGDRPNTGRDTHSPTKFIPDLGEAYRASGRTKPIMDWFAFHPYLENSSVPPTTKHPNSTTVAIADYDKLVALLGRAFDGTAQPGSTIPIVYNEFGVEAQVPANKASLYSGEEPATVKPVTEAVQGAFYRQAIQLAFCQPTVRGIFIFHVFDEPGLPQWQSGVYYADARTPKASRAALLAAATASRRGVVTRCAGLQLPVKARLTGLPRQSLRARASLRCDLDCTYIARVEKLPNHSTTQVLRGTAIGTFPARLNFPAARLARGTYRITASVRASVNPGPPVAVVSIPFRIR